MVNFSLINVLVISDVFLTDLLIELLNSSNTLFFSTPQKIL